MSFSADPPTSERERAGAASKLEGQTSPTVAAKAATAATLVCLLGFALTASLALGDDAVQRLDDEALTRLHAHDYAVVGDMARLLAHLGEPLPQLLLLAGAVAIGVRRGLAQRAVASAVVVAGANLTTQLLKGALTAHRYQTVPGFVPIDQNAFPSGHTTTMAALTFAYLLVVPARWRLPIAIIGSVLTILVGTAMVVLHRHWPTDVVGGILVAGAWGSATVAVLEAIEGSGKRALHRT
jgi:membrane-associated phospholipid phosphatase